MTKFHDVVLDGEEMRLGNIDSLIDYLNKKNPAEDHLYDEEAGRLVADILENVFKEGELSL